ncbi:hypothetical protein GQ473_03690 [archaeon]|nr:hypothetical protein [archaeon]
MNLKLILATMVFVFILAMPLSFAAIVSSHDMTVTLDDVGNAHFTVVIKYEELTTNKMYYAAYSKLTNLEVHDSLGVLACSTEARSYGVEIACDPKDTTKNDYEVTIKYDAPSIITQSMDAKIFTYTMNTREPTNNLKFMLILPEGSGLVDEKDFDAIYPKDGSIGGTGRRATITWILNNPPLGKATVFSAYFENISQTNQDNLLYEAIILSFALILIVFFRYKSHSAKKTGVVLSVLRDDEKKVLEAIQEKGENCRQRDIVKITDFSKARVSRLLDDLEKRNIIERIRIGRTNKVHIKDTTLKIPKTKKEEKEKNISPFS